MTPFAVTRLPVVVIDPGHGGRDPGATWAGYEEDDFALVIAKKVRDFLVGFGFVVFITREVDKELGPDVNSDLQKRCDIANAAAKQYGAVIFLSIHLNAGKGDGAEIYVYQDGGEIHQLAQYIVHNVGDIVGLHGEPIKDGSDLYVIRNTDTPVKAMLLEVGFIDGANDLQQIQNNIDTISFGIAKGFADFHGIKCEEVKPKMRPEDANKIIDTFLKPIYSFVSSEEDKKEAGRLADELRIASGQPPQNR